MFLSQRLWPHSKRQNTPPQFARALHPRQPQPLQCFQCHHIGHASATCSRDQPCLRCGVIHARNRVQHNIHAAKIVAENNPQPSCASLLGSSSAKLCSSWSHLTAPRLAAKPCSRAKIMFRSFRNHLVGNSGVAPEAVLRSTSSAPSSPRTRRGLRSRLNRLWSSSLRTRRRRRHHVLHRIFWLLPPSPKV